VGGQRFTASRETISLAAVPSIGRADSVEQRTAPEADATRGLYERHSRQIFNYCVHQLGSREEAEDATQIVFMNAFRALQRGVVPELESAWLFKIANNVILTRRRSSSRRRRVESPGDLDAIQDLLPSRQSDSDELLRLNEALGEMPEQQRKALLLREWQGLSYREIGDELGLSQSAVETLLFRARRTLANGLTEAPKPKKLASRLRGGLDLGSVFAGLKALLSGGAAVKVAVTAAAVATTAVASETQLVRQHLKPEPKAPLVAAAGAVQQPAGSAAARPPALVAVAAARAAAQAAPPVADAGPTLAHDARHRTVHAAASLAAAAAPAPAAAAEQAPAAAEAPAAVPEPAAAVPAPAAQTPAAVPAAVPTTIARSDGDKAVKQDERKPATTTASASTPTPAVAGRSAGDDAVRKDERKTAAAAPVPTTTTSTSAWTSTSTPTATTPAAAAQQPPSVKELLARLKDAKGRSDDRDRQWAPTAPPAPPAAVTTTTPSVPTTTTATTTSPSVTTTTTPAPAPAPPAATTTAAQPPEPVQPSSGGGSGWGRDKDKDRSDRGRRD
jgi:RNA polymerase sigma factor (sigma-70 family)